ncbi:hypothetical protein [Demequina soli]|uniref:hypothetical protein n=1 Tax=Demequina soli TaxID=1638987 RepID=UPI0007863D60|nr:hypothetical protein [Demequina soli]
MTLSREALTDVAAIAAAAPHSRLRLETAHGATVIVGDHPDGAMCVDGFRRLMAAWVDGCEPDVAAVDFAGGRYEAGILASAGTRYLVTRLSAAETAACLRGRGGWPEEAHAVVREDLLLDVSVVEVLAPHLTDAALDAAARDAQAALLVEELCREVSAA